MPYANKKDRKYAAATKYESSPEQVKNRVARNKARAEMMKAGKVHKGDGMEVDHTVPLSKGGANAKKNMRVKTASDNRSFTRNSNHTVKKNT